MVVKGEYKWVDQSNLLKLTIPLKGVAPNKVDIRVTDSTVKINYSPYLIDVVLADKIDPLRHKAVVKNGSLVVTLFKASDRIVPWTSFEHDVMNENDKAKLLQVKSEALATNEILTKEISTKQKERLIEDERLAVRKQMTIDEMERNRLENLKAEEKSKAEKEMYEMFEKMEYSNSNKLNTSNDNNKINSISNNSDSKTSNNNDIYDEFDIDKYIDNDNIDDDNNHDNFISNNTTINQSTDDLFEREVKHIPPPRSISSQVNTIQFTPRVFPTPLRESKAIEEENWVMKNRKHLKNHGLLGQNVKKGTGINITEEDPIWLKAKADDFFRSGDINSAINAYTSAIELDSSLISCYSNRSLCYYKIQKYKECLNDCIKGISIETLSNDFISIYKLYQCDLLKKEADKLFSESQIDLAISKYTNALEIIPIHVSCLSNRSACYLGKKLYNDCINDCTIALDILNTKLSVNDFNNTIMTSITLDILNTKLYVNDFNNTIMTSIIPINGSDKHKQWILKTITRRGIAYKCLGQLDKACNDYKDASLLDQSNIDLANDYKALLSITEKLNENNSELMH